MMKIDELLESVKSIGITGHIRPDGDCVGSTMGLYNYICRNYPEIEVDIYLEKPGEEFNYIYGLDLIKHEATDKQYDLFFVLDCSDIDRIEPFVSMFNSASMTYVIDHHVSNTEFGFINVVFGKDSSASEVLYKLLDENKLDKNIAECLYTGIIHDTGVFKYSATSEETMRIAGKLMNYGIDFTSIIDNSFYKKTYVQNQMLGRALLQSALLLENRCIYSVITRKEMEFYNVEGKDLGGIIEQLRLTDGVEVAIFLYETGDNEYKVSLRSKTCVDVSRISVKFGGGGHVRAAGCTMMGDVDSIVNSLCQQISLQMDGELYA